MTNAEACGLLRPGRRPALALMLALLANGPDGDWRNHGRDPGGTRFSPLTQIDAGNVNRLARRWSYDLRPATAAASRLIGSQTTPLAIGGIVYLATPYGRVVALDGDSGREIWAHTLPEGEQIAGRGLEYWPGDGTTGARLLFGTRSGRLLAIDATTGKSSTGFAPVDLKTTAIMNGAADAPYSMNSAPIVYRDLVITGARVQENPALGPSGDVRAWSVRTGRLAWTFRAIPRPGETGHESWAGESWKGRSGVNVWTLMSVDAERGILYLPFSAPSYDRIGIDRKGANLFSSSLVSVDAATGRYLWHFQTVHHDIWDYDSPAQPTLVDIRRGRDTIPAVVATNKTGYIFLLNRVTGKPIYDVREMPVPKSSIVGEEASPTQPIPSAPPPLGRHSASLADVATVTPQHEQFCRDLVKREGLTFAQPFEPLRSDHAMVRFPGSGGGPNWGGGAFDGKNGLYIINTPEMGSLEQMVRRDDGSWFNPGGGTSWFADNSKEWMCQQPPWGLLSAVDVNSGRIAWATPLGVTDSLPEGKRATGRPNVGGPIVTASGLVFIGATDDARFRAFDARSGRELWTTRIDASAHSTPISYAGRSRRQYVAIVASGGSYLGSPVTASRLIVFALPEDVAKGGGR